jgi:hypothetical protein
VLAHEFDHHVFFKHLPKLADAGEATHVLKHTGIKIVDRAIDAKLASGEEGASSLNEGFADLFGHYFLGGNTDIDAITCLRVTRDVTSATFADGVKKVLSDSVWAQFDKDEDEDEIDASPSEESDCSAYDFKDSHVIGAIVAHGVFRMFEEIDSSAGGAKAYASAEEIIRTAIDTALATAWDKKAAGSDQAICAVVEEVFPKFASDLKGDSSSSYAKNCSSPTSVTETPASPTDSSISTDPATGTDTASTDTF